MKLDGEGRNGERTETEPGIAPPRRRTCPTAHSAQDFERISRLNLAERVRYLRKLVQARRRQGSIDRHFVAEALLFAIIVILAFWPMVSLVERMATAFP